MLQIVPDPDAAAKYSVPRELRDAFRAEVNELAAGDDFEARERMALALANELVRTDLTQALEEIVEEHGDEDVLVEGERSWRSS